MDESNHKSELDNEIELEKQKEDSARKKLEFEVKLREEEAEMKRKNAAEQLKREQQQQQQQQLLEEQQRLKEAKRKEEEQQRKEKRRLEELAEEEERKQREKERLEEEDRKKRYISEQSLQHVNNETREKSGVEKNKKDELLAKLSLTSNQSNGTSKSNSNHSNGQTILNNNNHTSSPKNSIQMAPKSSNGNILDKPSSETIENLHQGKPVNPNPKNDLLAKLFGGTESPNNKADDLFGSKSSNNTPNSGPKANPVVMEKISQFPWETSSPNNGAPKLSNGNHSDFFSNLNSNKQSNGNNVGLNRPKLENTKIVLAKNTNHNTSATFEDVEELTL